MEHPFECRQRRLERRGARERERKERSRSGANPELKPKETERRGKVEEHGKKDSKGENAKGTSATRRVEERRWYKGAEQRG